MSAAIALPQVFAKTNYLDDIGDYLERTGERITTQGPLGLISKLFSGRIKNFQDFKTSLKTSVSAVLQTIKEGTAWATVGLSICNERLGKLVWALLPDSFKDPLPKIVKEHMDSPLSKILDELRDGMNPMVDGPKEDMRRKVHLRRALRKWRGENPSADPASEATGGMTPATTPSPVAGLPMGPRL
ncbi:MAG: hypothetical protein AAF213_07245 [Pseudomonadota bacterium]